MSRRIRNDPPIREIIREFLANRKDPVGLSDICDHVLKNAVLKSRTPRNSVFSVLTRMPDVERPERGKYVISGARGISQ